MAFKGQDFLFLSLRDLELPVNHLCLRILVSNSARRIGVVTVEQEQEGRRVA